MVRCRDKDSRDGVPGLFIEPYFPPRFLKGYDMERMVQYLGKLWVTRLKTMARVRIDDLVTPPFL